MAKKVFVGMSGGVDSSVAAALLKQQGYEVTGVYMKNWSQDLPGLVCPWREDFEDAKRVAVKLGIPFKMYDFEKKYRQKVIDYMVTEYRAGRTPNPDIMCNQEIKFKLFLETALADGADMIATGHYARIKRLEIRDLRVEPQLNNSQFQLLAGLDKNKDQSYFLYRVNEAALQKSLFPVGELTKPEVRKLARELGLATADKKDSQGICFVGKVGIKDFLLHELGPQPAGQVIDQSAGQRRQVVGEHDGAIFYTIGQRHGLDLGRRLPAGRQAGLPFYVTGKNINKSEVYVTTNLDDKNLWRRQLKLTDVHWINRTTNDERGMKKGTAPFTLNSPLSTLAVRTRYRAPLVSCRIKQAGKTWQLELDEEVRAVTPGQWAVLTPAIKF